MSEPCDIVRSVVRTDVRLCSTIGVHPSKLAAATPMEADHTARAIPAEVNPADQGRSLSGIVLGNGRGTLTPQTKRKSQSSFAVERIQPSVTTSLMRATTLTRDIPTIIS